MISLPALSLASLGGIKLPSPDLRIGYSLLAIGLSLLLSACGISYQVATPPPAPANPVTPVETLPPTPPKTGEAPAPVKAAILADLSQSTGQPVDRLQIQQAEPHTWPDGCLGLAAPDQFCTQALVPGWRVTVTDGTRSWVYRTNANGSQLKPEP